MAIKDLMGGGKKSRMINASSVKGEPGTGYEPGGKLGEFECENCRYFRMPDHSCGQKDMMRRSKLSRTEDGRVLVDPEGCCEYVDRVGRKDSNDAS